jgi:Txe/YoeB family toxin of Txe-Axe toxin-antitoxin module
MLDLRASESPESLGEYKKGKLAGSLAYRINKETRILYEVERENGLCKITLLRVCNHKQVYGRD